MKAIQNSNPDFIELHTFFDNAFNDDIPEEDSARFSEEEDQASLDDWLDLDYLLTFIREHGFVLEVRDDTHELLGSALVGKHHPASWNDGRKLEIFIMAVMPGRRGEGIGTLLLKAIETQAAEMKAQRILVNSHVYLSATKRFYLKNGYEEIGTLRDYYANGDAVFFLKKY